MQKKIFSTIGIAFVFFGTLLLLLNSLFYNQGLKAAATIINCELTEEKDIDQKIKKYYAPTLSFLDAGGKEHIKKFLKSETPYSKGQELTIIYNPSKPSEISIASPWNSWWVSLLFIGLGIGLLGWLFQQKV